MMATHAIFADIVRAKSDSLSDSRAKMMEVDEALHPARWKLKLSEIT